MADDIAHYDVLFRSEQVPVGVLRVVRLDSVEEMSTPPGCWVDLVNDVGAPIEVAALVRAAAQVVVYRSDTGEVARRFTGIITEIRERAGRAEGGRQQISCRIESMLHFLEWSEDARIYQNLTTKEIVSAILDAAGLTSGATWKLVGSYAPREVCTQFGENTLDFVMRILEEDGIFYFQDQTDEGTIVFADDPGGYDQVAGDPILDVFRRAGMIGIETVSGLREIKSARPGKVTLRDHDFKKPSLTVEGTAASAAPFNRELYQYPGGFFTPSMASTRAKLRLAALECANNGVEGEGQIFRLAAGHTIELAEDLIGTGNSKYVVHRVSQSFRNAGGKITLRTDFRLLPASTRFVPLIRHSKPLVTGPHLARVTGPAGEEIHCDEFGRVKVQFDWDRHGKSDEKSSGWVRVGQLHTSGSVAIPRVGWEVVVDFEDGDMDRPIVLGRVYNGAYRPPASLPGQKTVSQLQSFSSPGGGGHNQIKMDDGGGSEIVQVHAEKDMNLVVGNNKEEKVTTNAQVGVAANQTLTVGASQTVQVGANDKIVVGGAQKHAVGASRTKTISGGETYDVKGSRSVSIGGSHTIMTPMAVTTSTSGDFSETVGASCLEIAAKTATYSVAGSASFTIGAAKIEAVASGKSDTTIGARSSVVGGAFINAAGSNVATTTDGAKATTVGAAWLTTAAGDVDISSGAALKVNVGGAVVFAASTITLKVGGSTVSFSGGKVAMESSEIKLSASGPHAELAPMVSSK